MKLSGKEARELTYEDEDEAGILRVEARVHLGDGRWTGSYLLVVLDRDGRYWAAPYEIGLTENQDTEPFDYMDEVDFYEVSKVPVPAYDYVKKIS